MPAPASPAAVDAVRAARAGFPAVPDRHGSFPSEAVATLCERGLLAAPLPVALGGAGLCVPDSVARLRDVLIAVGHAGLPLGRLYEGHVNALALVLRYARPEVRERLAKDACDGRLFGVWNTEPEEGGLALARDGDGFALHGRKSYASGAGHVTRPLVTARTVEGRRVMVVVPVPSGERADLSQWCAHGMRASATGTLDFTGLRVDPEAVIGEPDDYLRQPEFSCGAWRFLAVQCGGAQAVFEAHREHLRRTGRGADPHQRARLGLAAAALETACLFVARASRLAANAASDPDGAVAYVNLARGAVERAILDVIELAQRSVGLSGFLETHPLERLMRDLATYLRQPAPDHALACAADYVRDAPAPFHALWPEG